MKLEEIVTNLELSKKLKALEVKQESLFYWFEIKKDKWECWELIHLMQHWECCHMRDEKPINKISAYTVSELGLLLPDGCGTTRDFDSGFTVWCYEKTPDGKVFVNHYHTTDSEADARGKMLIHLIENKLLKL